MKRLIYSFYALIIAFGIQSCYYNVEEELYPPALGCDTLTAPSFSGTVTPVLVQHCTSCHGGNVPTAGVRLDTYDGVTIVVNDGRLLCAVNHLDGCFPMPEDSPILPECQREEISRWIDAGANDD